MLLLIGIMIPPLAPCQEANPAKAQHGINLLVSIASPSFEVLKKEPIDVVVAGHRHLTAQELFELDMCL